MPLIGTIRGNFGHGRMIRVDPGPTLTVFNPVTRQRTQYPLSSSPTIILDGDRYAGNAYVISASTSTEMLTKIWAGGGGSSSKIQQSNAGTSPGGAGGAAKGTFSIAGGVEYTIFVGAAGRSGKFFWNPDTDTIEFAPGWGGAASGIIKGNVFALGSGLSKEYFVKEHEIIVGGGGGGGRFYTVGAASTQGVYYEGGYHAQGVGGGHRHNSYGNEYPGDNNTIGEILAGEEADSIEVVNANRVLPYTPAGLSKVEGAELLNRITEKKLGIGGFPPSTDRAGGGGGLLGGVRYSGGTSSIGLSLDTNTGPVYSVQFSGTGSIQTTVDKFNLSNFNFTIESWIYLFNLPTGNSWTVERNQWMVICANGTPATTISAGWQFRIGATNLVFGIEERTIISSAHQFVPGNWYHVAVTRQGSRYSLYRNGILLTQASSSEILSSGGGFYIGSLDSQKSYFNGYISNLRIVRDAVIYQTFFTPPTQPLTVTTTGTTILLSCQSSTFKDESTQSPSTLTPIGLTAQVVNVNPFIAPESKWNLFSASYSVPGLYDDPQRGTAGDQGKSGRVVLTLSEHVATTITATGGTITEVPIPGTSLSYKYHTFVDSGTFQITAAGANDRVEIFAIGGGGGGGLSGGGAGEAVIANNLNLKVGSYPVVIGNGGAKVDPMGSYTRSSTDLQQWLEIRGGQWGGFKGEETTFVVNDLAQYGFPDSYRRLIARLKYSTYYISPGGSPDNDGLTPSTAWPSIDIAEEKLRDIKSEDPGPNNNIGSHDAICYVLLEGIYANTDISVGQTQTAFIRDDYYNNSSVNGPRVMVCCPGKVIIELPPGRENVPTYFRNQFSAVYGAIFNIRNNNNAAIYNCLLRTRTSYVDDFSRNVEHRFSGSFYNCVFNLIENKPWVIFQSAANALFENCVFYSQQSETTISSTSGNYSKIRFCVANKGLADRSSTRVYEETSTGLEAAIDPTTYLLVSGTISGRGISAGQYSWTGTRTLPSTTQSLVAVAAAGGGGGIWGGPLWDYRGPRYASYPVLTSAGGSAGGSTRAWVRADYSSWTEEYYFGAGPGGINFSPEANLSYSFYSSISADSAELLPGENAKGTSDNHVYASGGGGVASPGWPHSAFALGGSPIEWPAGSGQYYGAGGPSRYEMSAPTYRGSGGRGCVVWSASRKALMWPNDEQKYNYPTDGRNGILIVRYKVSGSSTPLSDSYEKLNPIIYGGTITKTTATYQEQRFTETSDIRIERLPDNCVVDLLVVGGGGGGGSGNAYDIDAAGGKGGQVRYTRFDSSTMPLGRYRITIGSGGSAVRSESYPGNKGADTVIRGPVFFDSESANFFVFVSTGGDGGNHYIDTNNPDNNKPVDGPLITDGLFSDNTIRYGGGGSFGNGSYGGNLRPDQIGGLGGGGNGANATYDATVGAVNTGGGGGGGSRSPGELYGANGGSGIVIVRYTWFS